MHPPIFIFLWAALVWVRADGPLPGTQALTNSGDLSEQMVAGVDRFLMEQTRLAAKERGKYWSRDFSSREAYEHSIEKNRARLKYLIGATDEREPFTALEIESSTARPAVLLETPDYIVRAIRWPAVRKVHGEGLWLEPKKRSGVSVIAIPDADQTPEMLAGLEMGLPPEAQFARRLAEAGMDVFVPVLISRSDTFSGNAELNRFTNQPHREWVYRQAYELGRHIIGYEAEKIFALVDWLEHRGDREIDLAGYGEGGLIALYAAALDQRVHGALVSGYFGPRENLWAEPIYRNVFSLLREFGDAEIASMIAPRTVVIEYSQGPEISGPPAPREGRGGAAPGRLTNFERYQVEEELDRARAFFPKSFETKFHLVHGNEGTFVPPGTGQSLELLTSIKMRPVQDAPNPGHVVIDTQARQRCQLSEIVDDVQHQIIADERHRNDTFWKPNSGISAAQWSERVPKKRTEFWEEVIGRFDPPQKEMNPRSRMISQTAKWTSYDVMLDVWPDVFAWGILLVPNDLKPGEKRPVVVCQHGLEGVPRDTIDGPGSNGYGPYKSFAARLADQGFITFAPHNPYRGHDKFRVLQRKANPLGRTLFSPIIGQHEQILNWLQSLPFVDPARIGFYGLSYGGKSAMRIPAVLDRYVLSICSADFNDWVKKCATVDSGYSYLYTMEYDMPEFALGPRFNYAEMSALIAPRPFMVERGHGDGVAPDEWVAYEFAKVKRFYDQLGIGDRTEIEFFNGPHTINGQGTFRFLHQHLNWPARKQGQPN